MCLKELFGLEKMDLNEDEIVQRIKEANLQGKEELVFFSQGKKVVISLK
jgi:hypothetical protein